MMRLGLLLATAFGIAAPLQAAERCDAGCLTGLAQRYVAALAERGASARLPWAPVVRYAENGVAMMVDDGIWATVTAAGPAPLILPDPATGQVVWIGEVAEHGQPSYLALRLRAVGGRIAEAEVLIRRQQGRPPFADPATFAFTGGMTGGDRAVRMRLEAAARDALTRGKTARLSPDCAATENGVATPCVASLPRTVEAVHGLAFPVVDAAHGLVVAMGTRDLPALPGTLGEGDARFPHSQGFVAVYRIANGAIAHVQTVTTSLPYRMPTWQDHR